MYVCPHCEAEINTSTEICPRCGADLSLEGQPGAPAPPKPLRTILLRWTILLGILAISLWGFLWYVMPAQHTESSRQADARVVSALNSLHTALALYSAAQPGGAFPNSLEPLGTPARDSVQLAQSEGYQIIYAAAPPAPDGAIRGYSLQARAGNFGYNNFYADESGQIRFTRENRAASSQDPLF